MITVKIMKQVNVEYNEEFQLGFNTTILKGIFRIGKHDNLQVNNGDNWEIPTISINDVALNKYKIIKLPHEKVVNKKWFVSYIVESSNADSFYRTATIECRESDIQQKTSDAYHSSGSYGSPTVIFYKEIKE